MPPQEYSIEYSKLRLGAVLREIRQLKELAFPYRHSEEALHLLEQQVETHIASLNSIPRQVSVVLHADSRLQ